MDEVSFGPRRENRLPSRYRRVFAVVAAVVAAGAVAAGAALAVTTTSARNATSAPRNAGAARNASAPAVAPLEPAGCPPVQPTRPDLAALPAGMRPGALKIIIEAQFSGQCPVSR